MTDLTKTTRKIKSKLAQLRDRLMKAEEAFNAAWREYSQSHSRDARHAMLEAHQAAMQLHNEYKVEYDRWNTRNFEKLEGTRP